MILEKLLDVPFNARNVKGDVGIEIEVEGKNLPEVIEGNFWKVVAEGSLRHGYEYVLKSPISVGRLKESLAEFDSAFAENKSEPISSIRTSVHIHINANKSSVVELYRFFALYWLVEEFLVGLNTPIREGNLFCLRQIDADGLMSEIIKAAANGSIPRFSVDSAKYAALNMSALQKYGSLEFRFIKGTTNSRIIHFWVKGLYDFFIMSKQIKDLDTILSMNVSDPIPILKKILPITLLSAVLRKYSEEQISSSMRKGWKYSYLLNQELKSEFFKIPAIFSKEDDLEDAPRQEPAKAKPKKVGSLDHLIFFDEVPDQDNF